MARRLGLVKAVRLAAGRTTLADLPDRLAAAYGRRVAVACEPPLRLHVLTGRELSYVDLLEVVARLAGGLRALGLRPGDRVAICAENRIDYALSIFAVVRAGAVAVPLHHHLTPPEVESFVRRAGARVLIADPRVAVRRAGVTTVVAGPGGDLDLASARGSALPAASIAPDEPAVILYTSGTTGRAKGATLTSRSLLAVARLAALVPDAREERGVCALPMAHVMGLATFLCALLAGSRVRWFADFEPRTVLRALADERATWFVGVPAMYARLAEADPEGHDLRSVKLWASGADAMPPPLVARFRSLGCSLQSPFGQPLFGAAFAEVYGMVEISGPAILKFTPPSPVGPLTKRAIVAASPIRSAAGRLAARIPGLREAVARDGQSAVGIPIPPYRVRVVDERGKTAPAGQVGELLIRGPGVTRGYDRDPDATRAATADGWFRTGDLARKNRFGLIGFVSRKKDVIKHGGYSVFPAEVEAQLCEHRAVAEAAVFGMPHPAKGSVPVAVVALAKGTRASEEELLSWVRSSIAPYKAPRAILIVPADEIPRNANRKVMKEALKERTTARLERRLARRGRS